jgi:methylmalonyl-CoA mutase N-terminal domain/subunit
MANSRNEIIVLGQGINGSVCHTFYNRVVEPVWFSGYEIREEGASAVQEVAFTFSRALEYLAHATGDARRIGFVFSAHDNFFEEIAKFRAARRLWASLMPEPFGVTEFHARTASCSLTREQPDNNLIRTTLYAMAALLGGAQSVDAVSAVRINEVIAYESGIPAAPDAFGGSYFLEQLTKDLEANVREYMRRIAEGEVDAAGEIALVRNEFLRRVAAREAVVVGLNRFPAERQQSQ